MRFILTQFAHVDMCFCNIFYVACLLDLYCPFGQMQRRENNVQSFEKLRQVIQTSVQVLNQGFPNLFARQFIKKLD